MIFNSKSKKNVVGELSQKMFLNWSKLVRNLCWCVVFSINFLDFPESFCHGNGSFGPAMGGGGVGILTWVVIARDVKGPFFISA